MTGLVALISKKQEENVLVGILKLLEFHSFLGSDGIGIAYISGKKAETLKYVNSFEAVKSRLYSELEQKISPIAIGEIRFATHGRPSLENTPPHPDCSRVFFSIMDGVLSNYETLFKRLREEGHVLFSKTDAELISHIVEGEYEKTKDFLNALINTSKIAEGYFTAVILNSKEEKIGVIANGPKIYAGISDTMLSLATEFESLRDVAQNYAKIENKSILILSSDGLELFNFEGNKRRLKIEKMPSKFEYRIPGGFNYFMEREIYEIPDAIRRTLHVHQKSYIHLAAQMLIQAKEIFIIGSGTSYHAGLLTSYYLQKLAKIPSEVVYSTEFIFYKMDQVSPGTVIMAISQSGKSTDVLRAVREAKMRGGIILGILNQLGSPLMFASNIYLPIGAGPERAVPATKTFISQIITLVKLVIEAGLTNEELDEKTADEIMRELYTLPNLIESALPGLERQATKIAKYLAKRNDLFVSSRGINFPLALEGALKLKETAYIHAEGLEAGELRHGPKAIISDGFPVIMIMPREKDAREDAYSLLYELKEMGAKLIVITDEFDRKADKISDFVIKMPYVIDILTPVMYVIPLQLIALRTAIEKGLPVDSPRGLSKYVILKRS